MRYLAHLSLTFVLTLGLHNSANAAVACKDIFAGESSAGMALDFNSWLVNANDGHKIPPREIAETMSAAYRFASRTTPEVIVREAFKGAPAELQMEILKATKGIDHVGYLLPSGSDTAVIADAAEQTGLFQLDRHFASRIVARELGTKIGKEEVPTEIFTLNRGVGHGSHVGIEIFVPQAEAPDVNRWIADGVGTHVALEIEDQEQLRKIQQGLISSGFAMPSFMNNQLMENPQQGSLTAYFDLKFQGRPIRVELVTQSNAHKVESSLASRVSSWFNTNHRRPSLQSSDKSERLFARIAQLSLQLPNLFWRLPENARIAFLQPSALEDSTYETFPLVDRFIGEEKGKTLWSDRLQKNIDFHTRYYDENEREAFRLKVKDGKLYDARGNLFDSSHGDLRGLSNSTGRAMIVMGENGELFATNEQEVGRLHHSSLVGGRPVAFAGEAVIKDGVILYLKNLSGHYLPPVESFAQLLHRLVKAKVPVRQIKLESAE